LAADLLGEGGEGEQLVAGGIEVLSHLGQFVGQRVDDPTESGGGQQVA
jgi:hypothetical protein